MCLACVVFIYLQKPLNHMPNVVKIITERASELAALDKVVYYFSPRVSFILYSSTEQPTAHRTYVCSPQSFSHMLNPCFPISRTTVLSGLVNSVCLLTFSKICWSSNGIHAYGMGTLYTGNFWHLTVSEKCWSSNGIHAYGMGTSYTGNFWHLTVWRVRKIKNGKFQDPIILLIVSDKK